MKNDTWTTPAPGYLWAGASAVGVVAAGPERLATVCSAAEEAGPGLEGGVRGALQGDHTAEGAGAGNLHKPRGATVNRTNELRS